MPTLTLGITVAGVGGSITSQVVRTADGGGAREIAVPAGEAGTLTTRTDDETGELTLSPEHGITTGQVVDLYWSGGARYGITVGTVVDEVVPIGADDAGSGDVLPAAATAIVVAVRIEFNCDVDGDELGALALQQFYTDPNETATSHISFRDVGMVEIAGLSLGAREMRTFDIEGGDTNPFTGNPIVNAVVSNGSATNAATLKMNWVQDSTP